MTAVHDEYGRFLRWLAGRDDAANARQVANVVHQHLDTLIPTVSNGGRRTIVLTPILRQHLPTALDAIEVVEREQATTPLPWTRLKSLKLGPFRGFRRAEEFDLSKDIVLIQGPNGSGKSSLCEALELALLGSVEEAAVKRIDNADAYFHNIHERRHVRPELLAQGGRDGIAVTPNAEVLRFAVIEKNRIEGFARLAARTPAQAGPLIGSLLGLDAFNSFVGHFSQSLDNQLSFLTPRKDELTNKNAELGAARDSIDAWPQLQAGFNVEQEQIASNFESGLTFSQLLERLGLNGEPGHLQALKAEIFEEIPAQVGLTVAQFSQLRRQLRTHHRKIMEAQGRLEARAGEVSFRSLYAEVRNLQADHPGECPACLTSLDRVAVDPYQRAEQGLGLLHDLAELEEQRAQHERGWEQVFGRLQATVESALAEPSDDADLAPWRTWIAELQQIGAPAQIMPSANDWSALLRQVRELETQDRTNRARQERRQPIREEIERLEAVKALVDEFRLRRAYHERKTAEDRAKIDGFAEANAQLIAEELIERQKVEAERSIQAVYTQFLATITRYRDELPSGLLAHLNDTARDLYNSFNVDDHEHDLLAALSLPEQGGERIWIEFTGSLGQRRDALAVLSEGHLRCLGLAILLAKNIHLGLPLVIFDDAVNAIDHDHRRAIRDTLFQNEILRDKQIIMTCHSPEFITQLQNDLGARQSLLYVLDHHSGDHQPRVRNGSERSYLIRAHERLDDGDPRQALASSRQALENFTARTWRSLANRDEALARLTLVLRGPKSEPELRDFIQKLSVAVRQGVDQGRLVGSDWSARRDAFDDLLQVPETNMAWRYLNKGTHDGEIEDPEIRIVRQVIAALDRLSATFR